MTEKLSLSPGEIPVYLEDAVPSVQEVGTASDREAMRRLGKQQLFKVRSLIR